MNIGAQYYVEYENKILIWKLLEKLHLVVYFQLFKNKCKNSGNKHAQLKIQSWLISINEMISIISQ